MSIEFNPGDSSFPITLTEPDGTPVISPVTEIQVTNGTLTQLSPGIGLVDTTNPALKYVTTEAELIQAFDDFNADNIGGIIKLGANIQITQNHNIDFGNGIEVHGGNNTLIMNDGVGSYVITITGGTRATFKQVIFNGNVNFNQGVPNEEDTNSQVILAVNNPNLSRLVLLEAQFNDIVGGSLGNNTGAGTYNPGNNVLEGAPIQIQSMGNFAAILLSNIWFSTPTSGQRKPWGSFGINYTNVSTGFTFTCNNFSMAGPANTASGGGIPNIERFQWAADCCSLLVTGAGTINSGYAIINYDQSLGVNPNTNASWQLYPTFWGPTTKTAQDVDPTATATFGNIGDVLLSQYGQFYKIRSRADDTSWKSFQHNQVFTGLGPSYTPALSVNDSVIYFNSPAALTFLIPRDTITPPPIGTTWKVTQIGAGAFTIDRNHPAVTFYYVGVAASTPINPAQFEVISITKIAANTFICY